MFYDYHTKPVINSSYNVNKKYFYAILFIKSYVYNVKGQAIIFRRSTLESLMKLLNDFDETYIHSSYEQSYQNKALSLNNVDILTMYTDSLDSLINLIDQNSYVIKLSWQANNSNTQPYPPSYLNIPPHIPSFTPCPDSSSSTPPIIKPPRPCPPPPAPPPILPPKFPEEKIANDMFKHVKVTNIFPDRGVIQYRIWDDNKQQYTSMLREISIVGYSDISRWSIGDDALLLGGKFLQKMSAPSYKRVIVTDISKLNELKLGVTPIDDTTGEYTGSQYYIDLTAYGYDASNTPNWKVGDDAILFDNRYLQRLDQPEEEIGGLIDWEPLNG